MTDNTARRKLTRTETAFRARLDELGATLLEPAYLGAQQRHHVRCSEGHDCYPRPSNLTKPGSGICRTCALGGRAETAFRERLAELGATLLEPQWLGHKTPHRVRCRGGHELLVRPIGLRQRTGICRTCAGQDPAVAAAAFYARMDALGATTLGSYVNSDTPVAALCAAGHPCDPIPRGIRKGEGPCRVCGGSDPAAAGAGFLARLAEIGAILLEPYRTSDHPHRARCAAGHECLLVPDNIKGGHGCRICAGKDPGAAFAKFQAGLAALGAELLEPEWLGALTPHRVRCAEGHLCRPRPGNLTSGQGICIACRPEGGEWDAFYVVTSGPAVKFGITSGDASKRLGAHARDGYREVVLLRTGLPSGTAPDTETAVRAALADAGEVPLQGREYFDISCLALVLDVADSWLTAAAA